MGETPPGLGGASVVNLADDSSEPNASYRPAQERGART
jgi:hypothetical protein